MLGCGRVGWWMNLRTLSIHIRLFHFITTVFGPSLGGFLAGVVMVACFPDDDVQQEEGVLE